MIRNLILIIAVLVPCISMAAPNDFYGDLFIPGQRNLTRGRYEFRKYEDRFIAGKPYALEQHRLEASLPFAADETQAWRASAYSDYDAIKSTASFPNGRILPNRLWDTGAGISYSKDLEGGRSAGGGLTINSASDRPFSAVRNIGFSLNLTYKLPQPNDNAWILFLGVSNTRGFLNYVPMPGAAYLWKARSNLRLLLGVPFAMIFWQPGDRWNVSAFYFPIRSGEIRVAYGNPRGIQPYALANYRTRNYWIYDRSDSKERLFFDEGNTQVGVSMPVLKGVLLDIGAGNSFARRYYLAQKPTERKDAPGISGDNALFGQAKINAFF